MMIILSTLGLILQMGALIVSKLKMFIRECMLQTKDAVDRLDVFRAGTGCEGSTVTNASRLLY